MGNRQSLIAELNKFQSFDSQESVAVKRTVAFLKDEPRAFERECLNGHLTASAYVVDESGQYLLLTHHLKLDKWVQLGGHCDGEEDVLAVAKREVSEEAGLTDYVAREDIFDVDVHDIPEYKGVPPHLHYDIRYLFTARKSSKLLRQRNESKKLKWVPIDMLEKWGTKPHTFVRIAAKLYSRIGK